MQQTLGHYIMLAKRWAWLIILGIAICGGGTYIVTQFIAPTYLASTTIIINLKAPLSPSESVNASVLAVPTYAQLLTSPAVLEPVLEQHQGITLPQLISMITVKPQPNTELIELDVVNGNPRLAADLANEISQSYEQFINQQFSVDVQILPAIVPIKPDSPRPLLDSTLGSLAGFGLAIALIIVFEWSEDRLVSIDEVHAHLKMDVLTVIPLLNRKQREKKAHEIPIVQEAYRILTARLNLAQESNPFKLLMVTSSIASEGKSTISANLATFLAKTGKKVLLVEADLRLPTLNKHFQLEKRAGFASALRKPSTEIEMNLSGQATKVPGLFIVAAEVPLRNSSDLLQAPKVKQIFEYFQKAPYDYVIFDTPPLLAIADAELLSAHIHTAVLIVDTTKSSRKVLAHAKDILDKTKTRVLGVVINKSQWANRGYGYGYGYGYVSRYLDDTEQQADTDDAPSMDLPHVETPVSIPSVPSSSAHREKP